MGFLENEVSGATVLEGQGMGQILGNIPIFADTRGFFPGSAHDSYIILSAVRSQQIDVCTQVIEDVCGPLADPASGIVFSLPIETIVGLKTALT